MVGGGEEEGRWGLRPSDVVGGVSGCHSSGWSGSQEQSSEKPSLRLRRTWGWDWRGRIRLRLNRRNASDADVLRIQEQIIRSTKSHWTLL